LCTASVLRGSETGTIKAKDEFRRLASKVKFMNCDGKKLFSRKKEKFSERSQYISVGMEMERDSVDQIFGSWNETSQQQNVDGVLRDRQDELMTQYGPSGTINKENC
jgi:hypothetical protein